jgi:fructose-1,6-bisphosphatase/inositol monophosphatase family enzyme
VTEQLFDAVDAAIRDAAARAVMPRWRLLEDGAVSEKAPGEWVTDADHEAEQLLTDVLHTLEPGVPVVGEEAAAQDPSIVTAAAEHERVWLLDPLDGTRSFIAGSPDFATMVALVEHGVTTAAWVWQPVHAHMFVAVREGGLTRDGEPLTRPSDLAVGSPLRGVQRTSLMPQLLRQVVEAAFASATLPPADVLAAGVAYPQLCEGLLDYALYWRTLPWDHAPGELFAHEAGLVSRRLDGSTYRPWDGRRGLLTAASQRVWDAVRAVLPENPEI